MSALRQVLTPENFAKIQPGMMMETVRKMLGKPMKITPYALKNTLHYDWRYMDGPNESDKKIFTVVFDSDLRVLSTGSVADLTFKGHCPPHPLIHSRQGIQHGHQSSRRGRRL